MTPATSPVRIIPARRAGTTALGRPVMIRSPTSCLAVNRLAALDRGSGVVAMHGAKSKGADRSSADRNSRESPAPDRRHRHASEP
jgi:hypothetical protein